MEAKVSKAMNNRITTFICFDIETTGLSPERDRIIEIGALKVIDGKIRDTFSEFINPQMKLPPKIISLTGIRDDMLISADTEEKVIRRFLQFAGDYILIGHNISFDYSFIKTAADRLGSDFEKMGIDTLDLSRRLLMDLESKSLGSLCGHFGIINEHAHRAYDDAKATAMLYVKLCNDFFEKEPNVFEPKILNFKVKKNRSITGKQKNYLIDLIKYHKIDYIKSVETLTQSEASRIIDRIILEKGRINY